DVLFAARRYDEAIQQSRKTMDLDPDFAIAHFEIGQALAQKRAYAPAIEELQKANSLSGGDATCTAVLAFAYTASGRSEEAREALRQLRIMPRGRFSYPADEALIYASLGQNEQAMALLEKTYDTHFDVQVLRSPAFDALRLDPRFRVILRRI